MIASRAGGAAEIVEASGGALFHSPGMRLTWQIESHNWPVIRPNAYAWAAPGRAAAERLFARPRLAQAADPDLRTRRECESLMRVLHIVSGRLYGGVETALVTMARCRLLCPKSNRSLPFVSTAACAMS